jgi:hypothetical protein
MIIITNYIENIRAGFIPEDGTKGYGAFISRIKNLWKHSIQGKVTIIVLSLFIMGMVTPDYSGSSGSRPSSSSSSISTCPCDGAKFSHSGYHLGYGQDVFGQYAQMGVKPGPYCSERCAFVCEHYDFYTGSYK